MDPASLLLLGGAASTALAAMIAGLRHLNNQAEAKATAAWRAVAADLDARYLPPGGPWYRRTSRVIEARIDNVSVKLDHYDESSGNSSVTYTRAVATAPSPTAFELTVQDAGLMTALGSVIGKQRVLYDDRTFDAERVVRSSDEDLARHWINRRLRLALVLCKDCYWKLESDSLTLRHTGLASDRQALLHLAKTTAELAKRGRLLSYAWRRLGAALGGKVSGGRYWPEDARIELADGTVVEIDRAALLGASSTRVRTPRGGNATDRWTLRVREEPGREAPAAAGEPLEIGAVLPEWTVRSATPERAARRFDEATVARIREVEPRSIEVSADEVRIDLAGLVLERPRLEAALALARDLRTGLGSAYR